jgi:hypothetical protein
MTSTVYLPSAALVLLGFLVLIGTETAAAKDGGPLRCYECNAGQFTCKDPFFSSGVSSRECLDLNSPVCVKQKISTDPYSNRVPVNRMCAEAATVRKFGCYYDEQNAAYTCVCGESLCNGATRSTTIGPLVAGLAAALAGLIAGLV